MYSLVLTCLGPFGLWCYLTPEVSLISFFPRWPIYWWEWGIETTHHHCVVANLSCGWSLIWDHQASLVFNIDLQSRWPLACCLRAIYKDQMELLPVTYPSTGGSTVSPKSTYGLAVGAVGSRWGAVGSLGGCGLTGGGCGLTGRLWACLRARLPFLLRLTLPGCGFYFPAPPPPPWN